MRKNVDRLQEREENINSLGVKSENLAASAQGFRRGANRVRKQVQLPDHQKDDQLSNLTLDVVERHEDAHLHHCWNFHPTTDHCHPHW